MLNERGKKRLIDDLERQGARIRPTKNGWLVYTEKGTMGTHRSGASDRNADRSLRRDVERLGLQWPFES